MDRKKIGRPKAENPRNKLITFRVTEKELADTIELCNELDIRYVDIFKKGMEYWSRKKLKK